MRNETIYLAADHAGFHLKNKLAMKLKDWGYQVIDLGPHSEDRVDYPDFASKLSESIETDRQAHGVLICGSGQGMAMRANKYPHVRAALCWNEETAKLSRQHNDANVLCLGARVVPEALNAKILEAFINQDFEGGRHEARVKKISNKTC